MESQTDVDLDIPIYDDVNPFAANTDPEDYKLSMLETKRARSSVYEDPKAKIPRIRTAELSRMERAISGNLSTRPSTSQPKTFLPVCLTHATRRESARKFLER